VKNAFSLKIVYYHCKEEQRINCRYKQSFFCYSRINKQGLFILNGIICCQVDCIHSRNIHHSNPLLPYALILTEKEYSKISELLVEEELSQIVPIIRYQDRELSHAAQQNYMGFRFFASARMLQLDGEDINTYIKQIGNNKEEMLKELEQAEKVLEDSRSDYQTINQFGWQKEQVDDLYNEKQKLEGLLEELENHGRQLQAQVDSCRVNHNNLSQSIHQLDKDLTESLKRKDMFDDYINQDSEYMKNLNNVSRINGEISRVLSEIQSMKEEILEQEKQLQAQKDVLRAEILQRDDFEGKYNKIKDAEAVETLDGTRIELEGKLSAYRERQTSQVEILREQAEEVQQEISREEQQLQRLGLTREDYQDAAYDRLLEQELEAEIRNRKLELESLDEEYHRRTTKYIIFKFDAFIDRYVVLDLNTITNFHVVRYIYVLT
jgi:hypothetical protein